jgi:hypothetical protein
MRTWFSSNASRASVASRSASSGSGVPPGEGAVVLFLDQDPAADGAQQPAGHLGDRQARRDGTVMPYELDARIAHAPLLITSVAAGSRPHVRDDQFLILSWRPGHRYAQAAR